MKTAIQETLEIIRLAREGEIDNDLRSIRYRVEQLLEKEKQQIKDAYQAGQRQKNGEWNNEASRSIGYHDGYADETFNDYYTETFKQ